MTNKPFGQSLIENKLITENQLSLALKKQEREKGKYLGEILIDMGISQSKINQAMDLYNKRRSQGDILIESKCITPQQLDLALEEQKKNRWDLGKILLKNNYATDNKILKSSSTYFNMPIFSLKDFIPSQEYQKQINPAFASKNKIIVLNSNKNSIKLGLAKPTKDLIDALQKHMNGTRNIEFCLVDPVDFEYSIKNKNNIYSESSASGITFLNQVSKETTKPHYNEDIEAKKATGLVEYMMTKAISMDASDIHMTYTQEGPTVSLRIDGNIREILMPKEFKTEYKSVVSRIKILSGLRIEEKRLPQDGSTRITSKAKTHTKRIDIRVATLKTLYDESVTLRLLDQDNAKVSLSDLGMSEEVSNRYYKKTQEPDGMILVTGPTGSGKSTTLYATLNALINPNKKIMTAEDPIEYSHGGGIYQSQVNKAIDCDFSTLLKSFLRHDPDIMMVGEIRDSETAKTAIKAVQTGHLLLSTLHTRNTTKTLGYANELGVDPTTLLEQISCILGQRLVRKICPNCIETYQPDPEFIDGYFGSEKPDMQFYKGKGCDQCDYQGYKGRLAVNELWTPNNKEISSIKNPDKEYKIRLNAINHGLHTFYQDGLIKLKTQQTSLDELIRVFSNIEEERDLYQDYKNNSKLIFEW